MMKKTKGLFLWVILLLIIGTIGCNNGGGSNSGNTTTTTTTTTATASMVGTWRCDRGSADAVGKTITFNTGGTGNLNSGATAISNWTYSGSGLTGNKVDFNLSASGAAEHFQVDWDNTNYNSFTFTNLNPATPDANHYVKVT